VGFATAIAVSAVTARVLTLAAVVFAPAAAQAADAQAADAQAADDPWLSFDAALDDWLTQRARRRQETAPGPEARRTTSGASAIVFTFVDNKCNT
jgi:predicted nucleic acid-binding Zn ribbon protein